MSHVFYECSDECSGCQICNGGLAHCKVCGGAEGSLPTDCPGHRMDSTTEEAVYAGDLDHQAGRWVVPLRCWSCKKLTTLEARAEADGNCPHCGVEIEL